VREARFCAKCAAPVFVGSLEPLRSRTPVARLKILAVVMGTCAALGALLAVPKIRSLAMFAASEPSSNQSNRSAVAERLAANSPPAAAPTPTPSVSANITSQMANSVEVSGASSAFEGVWGGYDGGMIYLPSGYPIRRVEPSPSGYTFLLRNGTIVLTFGQIGDPATTASHPKAWAPSPNEIVLRMEYDTFDRHNVSVSRCKLKGTGISYSEETAIYDSHSRQLIGTMKTSGRLKKLDADAEKRWDKITADYQARNGLVDLGTFEAPAEK